MKDTSGKKIKVTASSKVECEVHGVSTTWGELNWVQQLAVEEGLDTAPELRCLLLPSESNEVSG